MWDISKAQRSSSRSWSRVSPNDLCNVKTWATHACWVNSCTNILSHNSYNFWPNSFRDSKMSIKSDFEANSLFLQKKIAKWDWFTIFTFLFLLFFKLINAWQNFLWRVNPFLYKTAKSSFQPSLKAETIYSWEPWVLFHHFDHIVVEFRSSRKSLQPITFCEWKDVFLKPQDWGNELWSKALTLCRCSHPRSSHTHLVLSIQGAHIPLTTSSSLDSENSVAASNRLQLLMSIDASLYNDLSLCNAKIFGASRLALARCHLRCFQCIPKIFWNGGLLCLFLQPQT